MSEPGAAADPTDEPRTISVLYVEDNQQTGPLVSEWLERHDPRFEVALAVTLDEATDRLANESFDAVVADYRFPGGRGLDLVSTARDRYPDLPFLLYSARVNDEVEAEADEGGVIVVEKGGADQLSKLATHIIESIKDRDQATATPEADAGDERLEAFADELVHDLRGPLSVAMGYLDLLEADNERTAKLEAALTDMEAIIDDLSDRASSFEHEED